MNTSADAAHLELGVNFASGWSDPGSTGTGASGDDGWFVYHNSTGVLEWDAGGHSAGGDTVLATTSIQFTLSGADSFGLDF